MESKKINQLATELAPELSDLTIIGDPTTGISKKITLSQMASLFTGTVEEYASLSAFPLVGTADTIYIALDTNILYRWNTGTSAYVELSPNVVSSLVFNDANGFDGTISLVGSVATLTITTALTQGSVPFIGASGALTQDNTNFFWDNSNKRLGINTNTPTGALDVFGSGIIGRLNGTSTNNAFLGFASAGSNKWSIGNVQSDHRFRIYNEAATSELFTVLPTGEIGIGIENPLTKLHIDGGASALIANLDANVSVAKSVSFRSDNSSRFNIEVSGTESGSNAGADLFIRRYSDAGALIDTPLTITRATGAAAFISTISATGATLTSTQTNLVLNTTTNTSFSKLSFQDNGVEKGTLTYANSAFAATSRRDKLEIANTGGIHFITQNAPLTPDVVINSSGNVGIGTSSPSGRLTIYGGETLWGATSNLGALSYTNGMPILASVGALDFLFYTNSNERMRITSGGNVGIGTSSPDRALTVNGQIGLNNDFVSTKGGTTFRIGYEAFASTGGVNMFTGSAIPLVLGTNSTERMRILPSGSNYTDIVIGTTTTSYGGNAGRGTLTVGGSNTALYSLQIGGVNRAYLYSDSTATYLDNASGTGDVVVVNGTGGVKLTRNATSWVSNSDERLKNINSNIENAIEKLLTLRTVNFSWKSDDTNKENLGLIAQDVEKVLPQLIHKSKLVSKIDEENTDETEYLGVRYTELIPVLVKAIQELKNEIDILKAK